MELHEIKEAYYNSIQATSNIDLREKEHVYSRMILERMISMATVERDLEIQDLKRKIKKFKETFIRVKLILNKYPHED
jgi:hypothetical protein